MSTWYVVRNLLRKFCIDLNTYNFLTIEPISVLLYVCMYVWSSHIAEYGSTGKVANPARGQLNRENE